jgi:predicted DsbA family dithiol-disulfide isomerase
MTDADRPLTIDVVSDVVCPWCYLGAKRLAAALAGEAGRVAVRWRPYQLDPTIPEGGLDRTQYMKRKFGRGWKMKSVHKNLVKLGAQVGLPFAFDKISRAPNTLDAHRLIRWSASGDAQDAVVERLFRAYFVEGRDIGDRGVLVDIAAQTGLDAPFVASMLDEGADVEAVQSEIAQARAVGVKSVPFFIIAGRLGVAGAQDVPVLQRAIAQVRAAMKAAPAA